MSSEYSAVKGGKLRLKGGDKGHRKKRKRKRDQAGDLDYVEGELKHGKGEGMGRVGSGKEEGLFILLCFPIMTTYWQVKAINSFHMVEFVHRANVTQKNLCF